MAVADIDLITAVIMDGIINKMSKILVLEDEKMLNEMICEYLSLNSFECVGVYSYDEALSLAYEKSFDLWIFDVKIIGGNGFELLKELRKMHKSTPCIFTTSLNSMDDLNKGFLSGCDDYLKKPFELAELLLRVKNLIKRNFSHKESNFENLGENLEFDIYEKRLLKNGIEVKLSKKELNLLALLLKKKNQFVSREEIYESIWEFDEIPSEMSLRVYIRNLRKIFKDKIVSKSKIGYGYVD